nr:hypothetical protein [Tanacetum cinerariifolium]
PPGIENVADDPEGDIRFLEELLINDSILSHESFDSNFEYNPSNLRPPPEPPDDNFDLEPEPNQDSLFHLLSLRTNEFNFTVHDFHRLLDKMKLVIHMKSI